jgi:hypothetical protein
MAHTITTQKLFDGRKFTQVKINIKGDSGTATELSNAIIFDASAYSTASTSNKLMEIQYCLNGFSAELFWDANTDVPLISLEKDKSFRAKYWKLGGLYNNAGTGKTGDILITTTGLASSTKDGYIILYVVERKVPNRFE